MLTYRLQVLLDQDRYRKLASEAKARGISVAAVVREAIDRLPASAQAQRRAVAAILAAEPAAASRDPMASGIDLEVANGRRDA